MSDDPAATNGTHEASTRARDYVVLEQGSLMAAVVELFKQADVGLAGDEWERVEAAAVAQPPVYREVGRVPSRNAAHALMQVGRQYRTEGQTPPLVAVSERMFQARSVNVTFDPKVKLS